MKTEIFRGMILGLLASSLTLCAGCQEDEALAEVPAYAASYPGSGLLAADTPTDPQPTDEKSSATNAAEQNSQSLTSTNAAEAAPSATNAATQVAPKLVLPEDLKISEPLKEVVKLVQAGVSEDVLLTYILNSTNTFDVGADEIVFLNDLGAPSQVITMLLQHDASPETLARKQAEAAAKPLSPELSLKAPATNVYPTQAAPPPADTPSEATALDPPVYVNPPPATLAAEPQPQPTTVNYFYNALAPYGSWIEVPDYGLCWQPTVAVVNSYWRPYSDGGRWYWTDNGWYWHSYYSWGWAPFHYGRWHCPSGLGWVWVPDTCWGPAWVTWRYTPYYCGWAPLPPRCHYVSGFGLYYGGGSVGLSFGFGFGCDYYTWIPTRYFCSPYPHHYYVAAGHTRPIYDRSTVINNYGTMVVGDKNVVVNHGVGHDRVARVSRSEIRKVAVREEPLTPRQAGRTTRLTYDGQDPVLVRPRLPEQAPNVAATPTKSMAELRRSAPPPGRDASAEPAKPTTSLSPGSVRTVSREAGPRRFENRAGSSLLEQPPVSIRPSARRVPDAPREGQSPIIIVDGRNRTAANGPPSDAAPGSLRADEASKPSSSSSVSRRTTGIDANDSGGSLRIERTTRFSGPPAARGGTASPAPLAPASRLASPAPSAPTVRPTTPEPPAPGPAARPVPVTPPSRPAPAPSYAAPPPSVGRPVGPQRIAPRSEPSPPSVSRPAPRPSPAWSTPPSRSQPVPSPAPSASTFRATPPPSAPAVNTAPAPRSRTVPAPSFRPPPAASIRPAPTPSFRSAPAPSAPRIAPRSPAPAPRAAPAPSARSAPRAPASGPPRGRGRL